MISIRWSLMTESQLRKNKRFKGHMRIQPKFLSKITKNKPKNKLIHRIMMKDSMGILMWKNKNKSPENLVKPKPNKN